MLQNKSNIPKVFQLFRKPNRLLNRTSIHKYWLLFWELIWTALNIDTCCQHLINFLETALGFEICLSEIRLWNLLGVNQESLDWLWGHFCESDSCQIWRADFESSPNLESWFEQLSKLRPGIISNKFLLLGLMWVCPKSVGSLQIETWCHIQQIPAVGSNTCLSEVC